MACTQVIHLHFGRDFTLSLSLSRYGLLCSVQVDKILAFLKKL